MMYDRLVIMHLCGCCCAGLCMCVCLYVVVVLCVVAHIRTRVLYRLCGGVVVIHKSGCVIGLV